MILNIPSANADFARAESAEIVLDTISQQLGAPGLSSAAMAQILGPLYGISWNRHIMGLVTTDRIDKLMRRLRNPKLKQLEYYRLSALSQQAYAAATAFPQELREWKALADRSRLDEPHGREAVLAAVTFLLGRGTPSPKQLTEVHPDGLEVLCWAADFAVIIGALWGVARATFAPSASSSSCCMVAPDQKVGGRALTRAVKKHASQFARSGKLRIHLSKKLKQKRSFEQLGPMQKIDQLTKAQLLPSTL